MKIIQIADWHIIVSGPKEKTAKELFNAACKDISKDDVVAVCICGDIIDKGSDGDVVEKYNNARIIFDIIKAKMDSIGCEYRIMLIPGNHDIHDNSRKCLFKKDNSTNDDCFSAFCSFAVEATGDDIYRDFLSKSVLSMEFGGLNWILCNSSYQKKRDTGHVDVESLKIAIQQSLYPSVIMMHHTLLSSDENDSSALRNSYRIIDAIQSNTIAILHGHTHGYKKIRVDENCFVVGVGPFLKQVGDINNQLNVIDVSARGINRITNYFYRADLPVQRIELFQSASNVYFHGNNIVTLIPQIQASVCDFSVMNNVVIHYHATLDEMNRQIEERYADLYETAEKWLEPECPPELYVNHGMTISETNSIEYVSNLLRDNPTSRRALITLLNQETVQKSNDDYLPSFDIVQFSLEEKNRSCLNISLYMRSLEVTKFLGTNICELNVMARKLFDDNIFFNDIDITILVHHLCTIDGFDAYEKAVLDTISKDKFIDMLSHNQYRDIINMLEEKANRKETIIRLEGLNNLKQAISALQLEKPCQLGSKIDSLIKYEKQIKTYRKKHSDLYSKKTNEKLSKLKSHFKSVVEAIEQLEKT